MLGWEDLMKGQPEVDWTLFGVIRAKSRVMLYADSGVGKSTTALDIALHVATGLPWNEKPVKQGQVYYIAAENPELFYAAVQAWEKQHKGFARWRKNHPQEPDAPFFLVTEPVILTSPESVAALLAKIEDAALIVIDTLFASMGDGDTKEGKDAYKAIRDGIDRIKDKTGGTVLVVHHTTPKGTEPYGGTGWHGGIQTRIFLTRQREGKNFGEDGDFHDGDTITLTCKKMTGAPQFPDIKLSVKLVHLKRGVQVPVLTSEKSKKRSRTAQAHAVTSAVESARISSQKRDFAVVYAECNGDRKEIARRTGMTSEAVKKACQRLNRPKQAECPAA